jgi:hypothetical protein
MAAENGAAFCSHADVVAGVFAHGGDSYGPKGDTIWVDMAQFCFGDILHICCFRCLLKRVQYLKQNHHPVCGFLGSPCRKTVTELASARALRYEAPQPAHYRLGLSRVEMLSHPTVRACVHARAVVP